MNKKIMILGAGVIGSVYAVQFSNAGYDVTVVARSKRLKELLDKGLLYKESDKIHKANVKIISNVEDNDKYDFILIAVRCNQIKAALDEVKNNVTENIITMVNTGLGYSQWENIVGKGRIIATFPGAGGEIVYGVLHYKLTSPIIQKTTFGEASGRKPEVISELKKIMKKSKIHYSHCRNMDAWQKSHLAMVTVLANGIYLDGGDNYTTSKNKKAIKYMCLALKENYKALKKLQYP